MKIEDAVILVGGKGTRLGKITSKTPKPLIKINGKPFLDYLLIKLSKYNLTNIYLMCSYKKDLFFNKYNNKYIKNTKIICIYEGKGKGTGGALFKLKKKINKNFLMLNGDTYFDINLNNIINSKLSKNSICMALTHINKSANNTLMNNLTIKSGLVYFSKNKTNKMNGGIYLVNKNILKNIKNIFLSFEIDILKKEIIKKRVIGKYYNNFFIDIGSKIKLNFIKRKPNLLKSNLKI